MDKKIIEIANGLVDNEITHDFKLINYKCDEGVEYSVTTYGVEVDGHSYEITISFVDREVSSRTMYTLSNQKFISIEQLDV